jgi:hypothetical protein
MLCEVCLRMFSSGVSKGDHHESLASFTKAAADGCYICTTLLADEKWKPDSFDDYVLTGSMFDFSYPFVPDQVVMITIYVQFERNNIPADQDWSFIAIPTPGLTIEHGIYSRRPLIPMAESLQAAQKWMNICLEEHGQCQKHNRPAVYPTQLLELGSQKFRLITSQETKLSGPYAALSYCWGPNPDFIRLTAENLQELRLGLPYSSLPIAFQEAVQYLKGLDIQYLWIDALCIIQSGSGSSDDWQSECGRMQDVYSNCVLNLTLAQASHPDQTCLEGCASNEMVPFETSISFGHDYAKPHTYTVLPTEYFRQRLYEQPVGLRAWVLQERLLATRVLSIGRGELFWDCHQLPHASESLPCGFEICDDRDRAIVRRVMELSVHFIPQLSTHPNLERIWSRILTDYTARGLTHPRADKLVALSAIATRMAAAMKDEYLAGHFWKTLPRSLNWRGASSATSRYVDEILPHRLANSSGQMLGGIWVTTPSWSWASMHGPLNMGQEDISDYLLLATAQSYKLVPVGGEDPMKRVENRLLLTIRTWCRAFTWRKFKGYPKAMSTRTIYLDQAVILELDDVHDQVEYGSECLLAGLGGEGVEVSGLLLRETNVSGHKVYERFGYFLTHGYMNDDSKSVKRWFTDGQHSITLC